MEIDISGRKFNELTAIRFVEKRKLGKRKYLFWLFSCNCGNQKVIQKASVMMGRTKSCGCLNKKNAYKLDRGEGSFNALLYTYKNNAKKRGLDFKLNKSEFKHLTSDKCYYCGDRPYKEFKRPPSNNPFNGNYIYNGIDRVDNDLGYLPNNCVSCCEICNRAKLTMNESEFIEHIEKIYNNKVLRSSNESL